jgi:hypothetical protein
VRTRGRNQSIVDKVIISENWRSDFFLIMMILLYSNKKARLENYLHLQKITLVEALEILSNNLLVGGLPFFIHNFIIKPFRQPSCLDPASLGMEDLLIELFKPWKLLG